MEEQDVNLSNLLRERMASEFDNLETLDPGTKEHSALIGDVMNMYKVMIDETDRCYYKGPHMEAELDFEKDKFEKELESNKEKLTKEMEFNKEKLEKELESNKEKLEKELELKSEQFNAELETKKQQFEQEIDLRKNQFEEELKLKKCQFDKELEIRIDEDECRKKQQKIDAIIDTTIRVSGIILPLMFYGIWMKRGFKFEEEGTYTSQTFRGLFTRFRPTKVD